MTSRNFTEVSRDFDYVRTLLADDSVDNVYHGGRAPLNGGGWASGTPKGRNIGQVWHRVCEGVWYATPETSVPWDDIHWYGPFYGRRESALFLLAMSIDRPQTCPCCHGPVTIGPLPERHLYQRDGITYHACGDR